MPGLFLEASCQAVEIREEHDLYQLINEAPQISENSELS